LKISLKITVIDAVIFISVILAALALIFFPIFFESWPSDSATVIITSPDREIALPLYEDGSVEVVGKNGIRLTVTVKNGSVEVSKAECDDLICVKTGKINREGKAIVCLPAEVSVRISSYSDFGEGVDHVAG